jgi:hypothetical protein
MRVDYSNLPAILHPSTHCPMSHFYKARGFWDTTSTPTLQVIGSNITDACKPMERRSRKSPTCKGSVTADGKSK